MLEVSEGNSETASLKFEAAFSVSFARKSDRFWCLYEHVASSAKKSESKHKAERGIIISDEMKGTIFFLPLFKQGIRNCF